MSYYVLLGFVTIAAAYPGIIHHEAEPIEHQSLIGESGHHHQVEHEHAKSHQSIKFEHFHPVPVYVKKEHSHLLHHPLEKGKSELELKQIHPETHHSHGGGLVLEDHRLDTEHLAGFGHGGFEHGGLEHGGLEQGGIEHGGFEHGGFEHGSIGHAGIEHGGFEGGLEHGGNLEHGIEQGGYEHGGYEHFAGYGGGEGLKAYGGNEHPEIHGHYYAEQGNSGEGYKFEHH